MFALDIDRCNATIAHFRIDSCFTEHFLMNHREHMLETFNTSPSLQPVNTSIYSLMGQASQFLVVL